jgi:hypothetical protein
MAMEAARTRFEVRVETVVSKATLATFGVPVQPTTVLRNTVYRFRVPADRDLAQVLHLLTERDVQVLEIRQCSERRDPPPREAGRDDGHPAPPTGAVVVPLRARLRSRRPGRGYPGDDSAG